MKFSLFLKKYSTIIQEEVNVKKLSMIEEKIPFKKLYIPLGSVISSKFGKDTSMIIAAAKAWSVKELWSKIVVFKWKDSWVLETGDYELRYQGLNETYQSAEGKVIISLDIQLDDSLIAEWIARKISRFLNQMRKTANFDIDTRICCVFMTKSIYLIEILEKYRNFLSQEALISEWKKWKIQNFSLKEEFENNWEIITFYLLKETLKS